MRRVFLTMAAAGFFTCALWAQDNHIPEFHGFAAQSFLYSGTNNYLGMNTSSGSAGWSEAAINVNEQVTDKLRVGIQFHVMRLGQFGDSNVTVDWALGDYKINRWLGVRAGKVKMRWGLFNDVQDADPGYLWSLLPEPMYAVDWRGTDLSQYGAELYGRVRLTEKLGQLNYSVYYGDYTYAAKDGDMQTFKETGVDFSNPPSGKTPGFDMRWKTPVPGLMIGGSLMAYDASGNLSNGTYRQPLAYWPTYYAQYERQKLYLSFQYMSLLQRQEVTQDGGLPVDSLTKNRAWFAMAAYHVTDKLQLGVYHTRNLLASAPDRSDPSSYFHDWAVSSRFDINSFFYLKMEGHVIDGTGLGFYNFDNPNGIKPQTKLLVAKVGFSF